MYFLITGPQRDGIYENVTLEEARKLKEQGNVITRIDLYAVPSETYRPLGPGRQIQLPCERLSRING